MTKDERKKEVLSYMKMILEVLPENYQISEIHAIDIRNPNSSHEFTFESDLLHELAFKTIDGSYYHILIGDPYEPFAEKKLLSIENLSDLKELSIRNSFFVEENRIEIVNDKLT